VVLFGGDGDDTLDASAVTGPAVLSGGAGNDILYGGNGRNVLLGGTGADELHGGGDDDLIVGGATSHDANLAALCNIMAEWGRTDAAFETRLGHLDGSLAGGLNGASLLNVQTVTDDNAIDSLFGNAGRNWFFAATNGASADVLYDLKDGDAVTQL
jgi:Ca2+-binding RTX toxin-like protein